MRAVMDRAAQCAALSVKWYSVDRLITGDPTDSIGRSCSSMRDYMGECGIDAKLFEPRP